MRATHKLPLTTRLLGTFAAVAMTGAISACSSSNATGDGGSGGVTACDPNKQLTLTFKPMYSAYEPSHTYQLPVIVNTTGVTLTASDPSAVGIQPDTDLTVNGYTGWMLTMLKAPNSPVTLTAQVADYCGTSQLTITPSTPDDWNIGNQRYNNGAALHFPMFGRGDGGGPPMGPPPMTMDGSIFETSMGGPACTNCHGATATMGFLNDVSHTPEQTGGFSDDDLIQIIVHGMVPQGGYFDPNIISMANWHMIHQWTDITSDEYNGIVTYLRSLTPAPQAGMANLGGFIMGGMGRSDASAGD